MVEHKHKIGFKGTILIEPKPHEPTKHQYDFDTATVYGFLKKNGLENEVKVNIEANHATLAGHSFDHEIAMADALGIFGSIDINRGDPQNGWDTDQFHNDPLDMTLAMYRILKAGGFTTGGFNFDAKVRRQSIDPADMFYGHVGGLDLLARTLLSAAALIENGGIDKFVQQRYAKWDGESGQEDPRRGCFAGVDLRCRGGREHQSQAAVGPPGNAREPGESLHLSSAMQMNRVCVRILGVALIARGRGMSWGAGPGGAADHQGIHGRRSLAISIEWDPALDRSAMRPRTRRTRSAQFQAADPHDMMAMITVGRTGCRRCRAPTNARRWSWRRP